MGSSVPLKTSLKNLTAVFLKGNNDMVTPPALLVYTGDAPVGDGR